MEKKTMKSKITEEKRITPREKWIYETKKEILESNGLEVTEENLKLVVLHTQWETIE